MIITWRRYTWPSSQAFTCTARSLKYLYRTNWRTFQRTLLRSELISFHFASIGSRHSSHRSSHWARCKGFSSYFGRTAGILFIDWSYAFSRDNRRDFALRQTRQLFKCKWENPSPWEHPRRYSARTTNVQTRGIGPNCYFSSRLVAGLSFVVIQTRQEVYPMPLSHSNTLQKNI